MLPLIYTNTGAAGIFLAACLIWSVPEMIGMIKQTAKVSRKEASVQDRGSMGILIGLQWVGLTLNFSLAGLFPAAAVPWHRTILFSIGVILILLGVALRWYAIWTLGRYFTRDVAVSANQKVVQNGPLMNGFLPTSLPVRLSQWWRTRDQGDSLALAQRMADIVGIDYYPRHALMTVGTRTLYLDGSRRGRFIAPWQQRRRKQLFAQTRMHKQKLMIAEGQAEPWETVTTPPNPPGQGMYSCLPEHVITNYNTCMCWSQQGAPLYAYLFWGAEYWMLRKQYADPSYLQAFARVLENA